MKKQKLAEKNPNKTNEANEANRANEANKANEARPLDDNKPLEYGSLEGLILEEHQSGNSNIPEDAERPNEVDEAAIGSDEDEDSKGPVEGEADSEVPASKEPVMEDDNDKILILVAFASLIWLALDVHACIEMSKHTQILMGPFYVSVALNGIIGLMNCLIIIFAFTNVKKTNIFVCVYVILLSILHYTVANLETMNNIGFALLIKYQYGMLSE